MPRRKRKIAPTPKPGWAVYLRTSSDENQKPELSRARQRYAIEQNVLDRSDMPVFNEYIDVLTGTTPHRDAYQRLLEDARAGKFSHVIVERADRFGRNDTEALRAIDELDEFGVAVRFANQPDLDPMDPDDRVIVTLSFTLARRESALLGLRVKGGVRAKLESGGYHGVAPDGYINASGQTSREAKHLSGRYEHWIELDPERAPIIRFAWDLLLDGKFTLEEICFELHKRGYRYKSGRPFVQVKPNGKRKANSNSLAAIFHNWTYAGWVTSKSNNILPKTIRGNWEALVTTKELERGIKILEQRDQKRGRKRKHDYLLRGLVYYAYPDGGITRLTCSTSNASRPGGGTSYYCITRSNVNFMCSRIDEQMVHELGKIAVQEEHLPAIRAAYTEDVAEFLGHMKPDEREQLTSALKSIEEEEARMARLYATGKITEAVWDSLWAEWQDRRSQILNTLESLEHKLQSHVSNLNVALEIITYAGIVYNSLKRKDQKELLRQMIDKVVIDATGTIRLELRSPFGYLRDISKEIEQQRGCSSRTEKQKADDNVGSCLGSSDNFLSCGEDRYLTANEVR
ncbi:MAG: recombinase family protein [Chloroflexota bacterium]